MTPEQVAALGPAFAAYLRLFEDCFGQDRTREHLHTYCRGLLSELPRKSVEPIALAAGTAVRTLQEFLRDHVWDHDRLRDLLQQRLARRAPPTGADDLGCVGLIDETSQAKKGTKTPGVQRQWCGSLGKTENCIVTVHLGLVWGRFKTLLDADLFLPQAWSSDRERCRAAGIPDDVAYRPKWRIALEQLNRAQANGLHFDWLTFDEYYGSKPAFLADLDRRPGLCYVGEVPRNSRCLTRRPRGRRPKGGWRGKRVDNLARFSSALNQQEWQGVTLARLTLADQTWEVRAGQVYLLRDGDVTERTYWLIVARNEATGEVKYFLSNAPPEAPLEKLLRVAFRRWNVEHTLRVSKTEIGFGHFEGRHYVALRRHLLLCLLVLGFVAEHTDRLRGEKSGDHAGAGVPGAEPALRGVAAEPAGDVGLGAYRRGHCLPPAA
ncbi:MAG TPA: IS701 family transposase [Nevskia sp.]|nr:IS701 family transposase [Nevskia sp.]